MIYKKKKNVLFIKLIKYYKKNYRDFEFDRSSLKKIKGFRN